MCSCYQYFYRKGKSTLKTSSNDKNRYLQIFFILWLWYTMLSLISFGSILSWIFASIPFNQRRQFIARRLELADVNFEKSRFKQELDEVRVLGKASIDKNKITVCS